MTNQSNEAVKNHEKGCNCAQAVACTYCEALGFDRDTVFRLSEGLGFGAGTQEICGALTGAILLAGMKNSGGLETAGTTKKATYAIAAEMTEAFRAEKGTILCRDIKTPDHPEICGDCIRLGAELAERFLSKEE